MKKELSKTLAKRVADTLGEMGYSRVNAVSDVVSPAYPGELLFRTASAQGGLKRFVSFIPDPRRQAFFVELGWAQGDAPLALSMRPTGSPAELLQRKATSGVIRLTELVDGKHHDWDLFPLDADNPDALAAFLTFELQKPSPEEARKLLSPLLADAFGMLCQYGERYFLEIELALAGNLPGP